MVPKKLNKLIVYFLQTNLSWTHIYHSVGQCIPLVYWVMFLPPFRQVITLYQNQNTNPLGVGQLFLPPKMLRNQGKGAKTWTWIQFLWWKYVLYPPCKKSSLLPLPPCSLVTGRCDGNLSEMWICYPLGLVEHLRSGGLNFDTFFQKKTRLERRPFFDGGMIFE